MGPYLQVTIERLMSRDMLNTPELPHGHTLKVPTKGMPSKSTQWVCPCHLVIPHLTLQVQSVGVKLQVSQPTLSIHLKGKIKNYSSSNSTPTHKAHKLIPGNNTQVATEP